MKSKHSFSTKFSNKIIANPKKSIFAFVLLYLLAIPGLMQIEINFSARVWLAEDDQRILNLNKFERQFGNDESIDIYLVNENGVFNKETISMLHNVTEEMWTLPSVIRVESLTNYNWVESQSSGFAGEEDEIVIGPFIDVEINLDESYLKKLKEKAMATKDIKGYFISKDSTMLILRGHLKPVFNGPNLDYPTIVSKARAIVNKFNTDDVVMHIGGIAGINDAYKSVSDKDLKKIFPYLCFFILFLLYLTMRSVKATVIPFVLVIISITITYGLEGYLGIKFTNIVSLIPAVVMAVGLADSIHILISYFKYRRDGFENKEAVIESLSHNFLPTLLTTLTTSVGFLSLMRTEIVPIHDLGILGAFGTTVVWLGTYMVLGPLLHLFPIKLNAFHLKESKRKKVDISLINKFKWPITICFSLLAITSFYLGSKNQVNSDPLAYFSEDVPISKTVKALEDKLKFSRTIELVIDSGLNGGAKKTQFLNKVDSLLKWSEEQDYIVKVNSILDVLKRMNQVLHQDKEKYYRVPKSDRLVSDLLFLYELGLPPNSNLNTLITLDHRSIRLLYLWTIEDTVGHKNKQTIIMNKAKELGLNISVGGKAPIYSTINELVVEAIIGSMTSTLVFIFALMLLIFKDFKISILSMLPNIIPITIGTAVLFLLGKNIDIGSVLVASVCLGIAVDDTIHFLTNFQGHKNKGASAQEAISETLGEAGKALIVTTLVLVMGFGSFVFGDFTPNRFFGILCAIVLTFALITDLLFLPAILLIFGDNSKKSKK
ncbi:MAG: putative RND superfamily exporter protein [Thermoproteota archaeon]